MKVNSKIKLYAAVGLTLGLVVGCGGGGSGSSETPTSSSLATLTPETSELMAKNVADSLPGCSFVTVGAVTRPSPDESVTMIKDSITQLSTYSKAGKVMLSARLISAREVNETYQGTCPSFPGSYTLVGTHDDGVDDVVMSFNEFCLGSDTEYSIINGEVDMKNVGIPSDTGPIPQYTEISTSASGLQVTEASADGNFTHVAVIDELKYTYGDGDNDPTVDNPSSLVAAAIKITDGRSGDDFNVSNVDISTYVSGEDEVVNVKSVTYIDPENGAVTIATSDLVMDEDGVMKSGSITVAGADNTSMSLTPAASGDNVFTVNVDGQPIGDMNCTDLSIDTEVVLGE